MGYQQCICPLLDDSLEGNVNLPFAAALSTEIRCPIAAAAFCTSSISLSALGLVGFTSMAINAVFGTNSRNSASFFALART